MYIKFRYLIPSVSFSLSKQGAQVGTYFLVIINSIRNTICIIHAGCAISVCLQQYGKLSLAELLFVQGNLAGVDRRPKLRLRWQKLFGRRSGRRFHTKKKQLAIFCIIYSIFSLVKKYYRNGVTLREPNISLKCCQPLEQKLCQQWRQDLFKEVMWGSVQGASYVLGRFSSLKDLKSDPKHMTHLVE